MTTKGRRVRYSVAVSLDGFIAGPAGLRLESHRVYEKTGIVLLEYAVA